MRIEEGFVVVSPTDGLPSGLFLDFDPVLYMPESMAMPRHADVVNRGDAPETRAQGSRHTPCAVVFQCDGHES